MTQQSIGIYTARDDLVQLLRDTCPDWTFTADAGERETCRIVVVDDDSHSILGRASGKSLVRLVLCADSVPDGRRHGEMRTSRAGFLGSPAEYLDFAADLADAAIHASQLEQEVTYLSEIRDMMGMVEAEAVSARITRTVLGILGLEVGTLFLHDPRLERYVVSFSNDGAAGPSEEYLPGIPPAVLQHALASADLFAIERTADGGGMVVMPLLVTDDLIGVVKITLGKNDSITDEGARNVTRYLNAVAQVLSNVYQLTRSRDLAMRDDLTKAFNRRFFESYLDEEIERSRRYGTLFSIIFLDLDDLKMVNNFYGHLTGSRTLQEVAKRILGAVRGIDKVVRFGGDEFCIILPQTDPDQAMAVAIRVRKAMTADSFHVDVNVDISITASFGIACYPTHAVTKEGLIRQADAAMYRVKSTTKNAVGVATVENAARPLPL